LSPRSWKLRDGDKESDELSKTDMSADGHRVERTGMFSIVGKVLFVAPWLVLIACKESKPCVSFTRRRRRRLLVSVGAGRGAVACYNITFQLSRKTVCCE
jgi:hypothetical protein